MYFTIVYLGIYNREYSAQSERCFQCDVDVSFCLKWVSGYLWLIQAHTKGVELWGLNSLFMWICAGVQTIFQE